MLHDCKVCNTHKTILDDRLEMTTWKRRMLHVIALTEVGFVGKGRMADEATYVNRRENHMTR